ncbi:unnamed protein product [Adineta ricciae]|uniref:Uncharacterized protein n=2 Tax=Adineta ricciae TaxID=249248 RepID=A0A814STG6_ADIRI|nr:unnamed protein product [Adineta ricciae]
MTVVQTYVENQAKVSLSRRIATYISSMNLAKIFRRHHHHHHTRESTSPVRKPLERSSVNHDHHRYNRPFSYHIPKTEQSSTKVINTIPYRIGLSSDSTLVNNVSAHDNDEIIRLPMKNGKDYKNRRYSSQLNANKRWLFRSMETLDGWKGKVFAQKVRTISNSSQSRSRSVENLTDKNSKENMLANSNGSKIKHQRALSPNRSIETITNRVMHSMGIHRKSTASIPNITRSPALTIQKQSSSTHFLNSHYPTQRQSNNEMNPSAILDFREISSLGFSQSRSPLTNDQENMSLSPSEDNPNHMNSDRDENDDITSDLSFIVNNHDNNGIDETHDPWDFSISWIDSLKEQQSPHRKIQFYENLIKLLEQDTLNIDELLVLRKILAKIWPTDESTSTAASDFNNPINSLDSKISGTRSLHVPNQIKRRSKLSTLTRHTAQRCSTILEKSPLVYEALHEQKSGHKTIPASLLVAAKAKPCVIENNASSNSSSSNLDPSYPQHLNPFHDETDVTPQDSSKETSQHNHESIRRYFERLTLLETIYEKLNIESNRTSANPQISKSENITQKCYSFEKHKEEIIDHSYPSVSSNKPDTNKTIPSRIFEMNVDGNGSISSRKSSIKRRAPTAPHISQNNEHHSKTPTMFTLSSADVNDAASKHSQETIIPIQIQSHKDKISNQINLTERVSSPAYNLAASCDDDGHIFVYDVTPTQTLKHSNDEQPSATSPKRAERIQEWLSTCDTREQSDRQHDASPTTQVKIRCTAKSINHRIPSPPRYHESNHFPLKNDEVEPGRFRTSLKIHLETNELSHPPTRTVSATLKPYPRPSSTLMEESDTNDYQYFERNTLSPSFLRDHQAVYL